MKTQILKILNQSKGIYLSDQKICDELHLSCKTVSSYINQLKKDGYHIKTSEKKGYCLTQENDPIFIDEIKANIPDFFQNIEYFETINSTNQWMKEHPYHQGDIVIANHQTDGKGRNGRSFYSPRQTGIYVSFLLEPNLYIQDTLKITACLACAIVHAIRKNYPLDPKIKWVNDIMLEDKKIAGILCESSLEINTTKIDKMIVGIGINVHHQTMTKELETIVGSIEDFCNQFVPRQKIMIDFFNYFYHDYCQLSNLSFLDTYKTSSYVLHQPIIVYENNTSYEAYVTNINDDGSLTLKVGNKEKVLRSGEISIRKLVP